jgi:hypothetical protein
MISLNDLYVVECRIAYDNNTCIPHEAYTSREEADSKIKYSNEKVVKSRQEVISTWDSFEEKKSQAEDSP